MQLFYTGNYSVYIRNGQLAIINHHSNAQLLLLGSSKDYFIQEADEIERETLSDAVMTEKLDALCSRYILFML